MASGVANLLQFAPSPDHSASMGRSVRRLFHDGGDSIDLDQVSADSPGNHYAYRFTLRNLPDARVGGGTTRTLAAVPELTKQRTHNQSGEKGHGRKSHLCCDAIPDP